MNIVWLEFCASDEKTAFWPCFRTIESLTPQRAVWMHWQKFLEDPETYLTWKYIGEVNWGFNASLTLAWSLRNIEL